MQSLAAGSLAWCLATPLDDTVSQIEASNGIRSDEHIHLHESAKDRTKATSSLTLFGAETSQQRRINICVCAEDTRNGCVGNIGNLSG